MERGRRHHARRQQPARKLSNLGFGAEGFGSGPVERAVGWGCRFGAVRFVDSLGFGLWEQHEMNRGMAGGTPPGYRTPVHLERPVVYLRREILGSSNVGYQIAHQIGPGVGSSGAAAHTRSVCVEAYLEQSAFVIKPC